MSISPGWAAKLQTLVCKATGESWTDDDRLNFASLYTMFSQQFYALGGSALGLTPGDALLVYLAVYRYSDAIESTPAQVRENLSKLWDEIKILTRPQAVELQLEPATKQGAASTFLRDTLRRISLALGQDEEAFQTTLARSFLVSADNAHAIHPDHPEYADRGNCPRMNGGVVIKFNANQRYATDGRSCAIFRAVCENAGTGHGQPLRPARRLHPGQHRRHAGTGEHRGHRPCPAGHALLLGDHGRAGLRLSGRSSSPHF